MKTFEFSEIANEQILKSNSPKISSVIKKAVLYCKITYDIHIHIHIQTRKISHS